MVHALAGHEADEQPHVPKRPGPSAATFGGGQASPAALLAVQRLAGNRAATSMITGMPRSARPLTGGSAAVEPLDVQRLPAFLKKIAKFFSRGTKKTGAVAGGTKAGGDTPVTDKTGGEEQESLEPATKPKEVPEHPPKAAPGFNLAGGQEILTKAFGSIKTIVPGKLELLEADAFKVAYDKIYGSGQWSWDQYVVPTYGSLNGFAHSGVNYINKASAGLHTVVHEMLHNNVADDWRGVVGSRWDEGATEVLTKTACALFNEPAPVCYPGESPVVDEAIRQGLPLADLEESYLKGGALTKVAGWVDAHCASSWSVVKGHMEAKDWAAAKAALGPKPTGTAKPTSTPVGTGATAGS